MKKILIASNAHNAKACARHLFEQKPTEPAIPSAHDAALNSKEYLPWLHKLTELGYKKGVILEPAHGDVIATLFLKGLPPEQALPRYIDFKARMEALSLPY